jgi:hypothetical protein
VGAIAVWVACAAAFSLLAACGDEQIQEHEVAKGVEPIVPSEAPAHPEQAPAPEVDPDSPWVVPEGWSPVPGERPMRLATFEIPDPAGAIEVAVTRFPGDVGGVLANINRWRGQMGLGPVSEAELETFIQRFEAPGYTGYWARIRGEQQHMIAAGVHEAGADRTWFVRVIAGPDAADRVQDEVIAFARSIAGADEPGEG